MPYAFPPFVAAVLAAALLAGCGSTLRPILLGDEDRRSYRHESPEEEGRAQSALAEIQSRIEKGELPKIQFDFDSDEITPESHQTLNLIAELLLNNPRLKVFVRAHTDIIGSDDYNLDLSERRARSVKGYLVLKGVPPPSIRFKGLGSSQPLDDNGTEQGRAVNRRVEFRVTYRDWEAVY